MILLDTHVLVWWLTKIEPLPHAVVEKIESHQKRNQILVSSMSFWEIAMLVKKRRLELHDELHSWMNKIVGLPFISLVPTDHLLFVQSVMLPEPFHADPADRVIVATAQAHGALLLTKDEKIRAYPHVRSFWC